MMNPATLPRSDLSKKIPMNISAAGEICLQTEIIVKV
jgi:hypothetical protein